MFKISIQPKNDRKQFLNLKMETLIVHPKNQKQLAAVKAVLNALNVTFEKEENDYDPEFVAKIKKSEKNFKEGKFTILKVEELWK